MSRPRRFVRPDDVEARFVVRADDVRISRSSDDESASAPT
jgi:hypothetical protein